MKIAVISDIHSNHIALEACLSYLEKRNVDAYLFLGDYVSDCPYPQKTMQLLYEMRRKYQCFFIRGNREEYMLDHETNLQDGWNYSSASGSLLYTYENLLKEDMDFFRSLDNKGYLSIQGYPAFEYCHGSLYNTRELLNIGSTNAKKALSVLQTDMLICGHTHEQGTYIKYGKKLINTGTVGIPIKYAGKALFTILHCNAHVWEEEYIQVEYDTDRVIQEFEQSGLDVKSNMWAKIAKNAIVTGIDYSMDCVKFVSKLNQENSNKYEWTNIPEKYWEMAAKHYGVIS
jgi:putative phosphoesterase